MLSAPHPGADRCRQPACGVHGGHRRPTPFGTVTVADARTASASGRERAEQLVGAFGAERPLRRRGQRVGPCVEAARASRSASAIASGLSSPLGDRTAAQARDQS